MNTRLRAALLFLGTPALLVPPSAAPRPTLTVFAAASLTDAFGELGRTFEQQHRGVTVRFSFAGSQQLASELEQGASADVFASADERWMTYAKDKGRIDGEPRIFARNRLVVIVPRTNPARITALADLARRGTKVVMAAEAVPVGRYSREALQNLAGAPGFPAQYDRRALANVVSQEENVKGVVAKVQLGEADAGVVYQSDVTPSVSRYVRVFGIPDEYNVIASYPIAAVKGTPNAAAARQFMDLVSSAAGQSALQAHGLLPAAASEPSTRP